MIQEPKTNQLQTGKNKSPTMASSSKELPVNVIKSLTLKAQSLTLDEAPEEEMHRARLQVVGRILSDKKNYTTSCQVWAFTNSLLVQELEMTNTFLFKFKSESDKMRVTDATSYSIHKSLIIIKEWEFNNSIGETDFSTENVWVQLSDLPMNQPSHPYECS